MADATQGDSDVQYLGLLAPALMALIAGLLIHSFIIGVNVSDWWKGRSVAALDDIVTSLGISRLCAQCVTTFYLFLGTFFQSSLDSHVTPVLSKVYAFFLYVNFWLTSLLSIVFCLKISNFHSKLFLYLRGMIMHRTGSLIVASLLLSALNSVSPFLAIPRVNSAGTYNTTIDNLFINQLNINPSYTFIIGSCIPLLFYYISSVLLFSSLFHHTIKMKMSSNSSTNLEKYYSAMKYISLTFIYNTLYFTGHFISVYCYFYYVVLPWLYFILGVLPVLHSFYLIYITAKLRSQMFKVLQNVIDFLFQRKDTETGENIEVVTQ